MQYNHSDEALWTKLKYKLFLINIFNFGIDSLGFNSSASLNHTKKFWDTKFAYGYKFKYGEGLVSFAYL